MMLANNSHNQIHQNKLIYFGQVQLFLCIKTICQLVYACKDIGHHGITSEPLLMQLISRVAKATTILHCYLACVIQHDTR